MAIGTGTKQLIERQVEGLGSNLLIVVPGRLEPGAAPTSSPLTLDDVDVVDRVVGDRSRVAVTISSGETVRAGSRSAFVSMQGVLETTPSSSSAGWTAAATSTRTDVTTARRVAVLGAGVAGTCSPTATRSAARSPSAASGSG